MMTRTGDRDERRAQAAMEITTGMRALRVLAAPENATRNGTSPTEGPGTPASHPPDGVGIEVRPANAYEAVTRQMVEALQEDLREIKGRLNTLLFAIVGGVAIDVVARLLSR